jgi:hypothetical protein
VIIKCPGCDNDDLLKSIPISDNEVYEIDSSQKSKIKLEAGEYCTNEWFELAKISHGRRCSNSIL